MTACRRSWKKGKALVSGGDLGELDADGYLRFAVGSSALEGRRRDDLSAGAVGALRDSTRQPATDRAAVEGVEHEQGRQVVLFTTESLHLREANALLMPRLPWGAALDEVRRMAQIPMLGTGKTDYKQLRALILQGTTGHAP